MSDYFDRIERQLVERVTAPSRRSRLIGLAAERLVPAGAILVAVAVVAVFFALGGPRESRPAPGGRNITLAYVARATQPGVSLDTALRRAVSRLRARLTVLAPGVTVVRHGAELTLRGVTPATRPTVEAVVRPGQLEFYDWEAIALTPTGQTVASRLRREDPTAVTISQGAGAGPGAGAGGLSLYRAVTLAARQPALPAAAGLSRRGPLYYLFGSPGSRACATVARLDGTVMGRGEHCLLAGPDTSAGGLGHDLPANVPASAGERLRVAPGTVVLQATGPTTGQSLAPPRPAARFYVLRDEPSLSGADIVHPRRSVGATGQSDVVFGFTAPGEKRFERVTKAIASRGAADSPSGAATAQLQHFAIALDGQLLSLPSIDFKQYPDGVTGAQGADITGGFTAHTAQELATILRTGPLAVWLIPLR